MIGGFCVFRCGGKYEWIANPQYKSADYKSALAGVTH